MVVWAKAVVAGDLLDAKTEALRMASYHPIDPAQPDGAEYGSGMLRAGHAGLIFGYNSPFLTDHPIDPRSSSSSN